MTVPLKVSCILIEVNSWAELLGQIVCNTEMVVGLGLDG